MEHRGTRRAVARRLEALLHQRCVQLRSSGSTDKLRLLLLLSLNHVYVSDSLHL